MEIVSSIRLLTNGIDYNKTVLFNLNYHSSIFIRTNKALPLCVENIAGEEEGLAVPCGPITMWGALGYFAAH